jgi:hypothetical protein
MLCAGAGQDRKGNAGTHWQVPSTTLQLRTVMESIHLSSTPYIRGSFRVMWPCVFMKRVKGGCGRRKAGYFAVLGMNGKPWTMQV